MSRAAAVYIAVPSAIVLTIGALVCIVFLHCKQRAMEEAVGSSFEDNLWGFGQVISISIGAPLLIQFIYSLFRRILEKILGRLTR